MTAIMGGRRGIVNCARSTSPVACFLIMSSLLGGDALIALVTLTTMEIVLGIDNVVFIAILTGRLPADRQNLARRLGIGLALVIRIGLLLAISWIMGLTRPLVSVPFLGQELSGRDLILLGGGLFLIGKATWEIYDKLEVADAAPETHGGHGAFFAVLVQILVLDIVFSLDSVITAVGMANDVTIMVIAMVIAMLVMLVSARPIGAFVEAHPSVKILALAFLLLIGVMLVAESMGSHVGKGYIYAAMAFSLFVELLNLRYRSKRKPVRLHQRLREDEPGTTPR
jgi:predicted tellurium resistance membrane protein TerC